MAAFCACCGAEIGPKAEACPACGAPQHGMIPKDAVESIRVGAKPKRDEKVRAGSCCLI